MPYEGETYGAIAVAVANCAYTAVSQRRPELPPAMDAWFATAFAFKIGARFQTARELATTFAEALNGTYAPAGDSAHGPTVPVRGSLGSQPEIPAAPRAPSAPDLGAEARESSRLAVAHTQLLDSAVNLPPVAVPMREPAASVTAEGGAAPVPGRSVRGMLLAGVAVLAVLAVAGGALVFVGGRPSQGGGGASLVQTSTGPTASVATAVKSADPPLPPPPELPTPSATAPASGSAPVPNVVVPPRQVGVGVGVGTAVKPRPSASVAPVAPTKSAAPVPSGQGSRLLAVARSEAAAARPEMPRARPLARRTPGPARRRRGAAARALTALRRARPSAGR